MRLRLYVSETYMKYGVIVYAGAGRRPFVGHRQRSFVVASALSSFVVRRSSFVVVRRSSLFVVRRSSLFVVRRCSSFAVRRLSFVVRCCCFCGSPSDVSRVLLLVAVMHGLVVVGGRARWDNAWLGISTVPELDAILQWSTRFANGPLTALDARDRSCTRARSTGRVQQLVIPVMEC